MTKIYELECEQPVTSHNRLHTIQACAPLQGFFQIRVKEYLNDEWSKYLDGWIISHEDPCTVVTGKVNDSQELYNLLNKIREHNLNLLSVSRL